LRKKVIVSVINDLVTDQRVNKVCQTLLTMNCDVLLIGRKMRNSPELENRDYAYHRMKLMFEKGPLFYAEFNFRLFFFLIFKKADMLISNDLDTLLPNYLVKKIKKIPLVYDAHEYFTEVPELVNRRHIQGIWKFIERKIFPNLTDVITVNDSISDLYYNDYGTRPHVVRNIPRRSQSLRTATRKSLGLPDDNYIIILQGSGINVQRGAEELVEAMQFVDNTILLIIGGGDVINLLKDMVNKLDLKNKVIFKPRLPYEQMMQYTAVADLGLTLDKPTNLNYKFSLPNKLFDYIQAGIPVLSSVLPEIEKIILKYHVGDFITDHNPRNISDKINHMLKNQALMMKWKKNCSFAAEKLTWENEEKILKEIYSKYV
jgi:glycosyltransferase involved in cell wall biosynthesis|tara:strand:- start:17 stop:1135 length:1119 start_codon:yes stop_codon:yes gene_type:complete